jgi:hypothetical protein
VSLINIGVGGNGDDKRVTKSACLLEVGNMARMDDIEAAMAVDNNAARLAPMLPPVEERAFEMDLWRKRSGKHGSCARQRRVV